MKGTELDSTIFRGAFIRFVDLRFQDETGKFVRIHVTSDLTDVEQQALGWDTVPVCVPKGDLTGTLVAHNLIFTPSGDLAKSELQVPCDEVGDFQLVRTKDGEGEAKGEELRFIIRSTHKGAAALLEAYMEAVGRAPAQLKITHDPVIVQPSLPFAGEKERSAQGTLLAIIDAETEDIPGKDPEIPGAIASKADVERATATSGPKLLQPSKGTDEFPVSNARGFFSADKADHIEYRTPRVGATIHVLGIAEGFISGEEVVFSWGEDKQVAIRLKKPAFASESEARELAAKRIFDLAAERMKGVKKTVYREELDRLQNWAAGFFSKHVLAGPSERKRSEEVQVAGLGKAGA